MFGENATLQINDQAVEVTDFKIIGTATSGEPYFNFKSEPTVLKLVSSNRRGIYQILLAINTYIVFDKKLKKTLRIYKNAV